jgi:hypothetical protein
MARRKRRSQKSFDIRLAKDLRAERVAFLRKLSEMVSNAVGVRIRCVFAGGDVVVPKPTKPKRGKVERRVAHVAGYQDEPPPKFVSFDRGPRHKPGEYDDGTGGL